MLVDGAWRRSPVPATQLENVTHGICPECRDRAEAALDGAQA